VVGVVYDVSAVLPVGTLPPETNLLVSGPGAATGDLLVDLLADGVDREEGALAITTERTAPELRSALADRGGDGESGVAVVDCAGGADDDHPRTRRVDSPADFTAAGVAASELLGDLERDRGQVRVGVDSVSGLLAHADAKTVFRFLHVLTGRIAAADAVGFATVDETAHDDQTVTTIRQLYDGLVEVRGGDDPAVRVRGLADADGEWRPRDPDDRR
jgi:hypothetical protein